MEQLNIFEFNGPQNYSFNSITANLKQILEQFNIGVIKFRNQYFKINENDYLEQCSYLGNCNELNIEDDLTSTILSVDRTGKALYRNIKFSFGKIDYAYYGYRNCLYQPIEIIDVKISEWKELKKLSTKYNLYQTKTELLKIARENYPYAMDFVEKYSCVEDFLMAPYLETLCKAGYDFVDDIVKSHGNYREKGLVENFNRLCQPGTKPKTIFKTSKAVYTTLKHEVNLSLWDAYRKLDKFGRINQDTIKQTYEFGFNEKDLVSINSILNKQYEGNPVFSWESLTNYLQRLDMYEAIEKREALMLLNDYLMMCQQLKVKPKIDGDSLKREHDVLARLSRQVKNQEIKDKLDRKCLELTKYNYEEEVYFIRAIKGQDDLIDEASQQHNCVASYSNRIIKGESLIYVMREKIRNGTCQNLHFVIYC
jgi:hypothetical protein